MTPKEKAEDLIKKMLGKNPNRQDGISSIDIIQAKLCALVTVDEIIEALHAHHWQNRLIIDYYEEVKQEIKQL
jgi:hypothetical protein